MTIVGALVTFAAACSGGDAPADCAWLASDNCWKTTIAAAASCLPPANETGTLDVSGKTCTYASGETVSFPLPLTATSQPTWTFSVKKNDVTCLSYQSDVGTMSATTGAGTFSETSPGVAGLLFQCPDGSGHATDDGFALSSCGTATPGATWRSPSDGRVIFDLVGTSSGTTQLFDCARAP